VIYTDIYKQHVNENMPFFLLSLDRNWEYMALKYISKHVFTIFFCQLWGFTRAS